VPKKSADLHGSAPDQCRVALLLIDVINDLEFEGGERLLEQALPAAAAIAALKRRARAAGIPTVYVNDNFGRWKSDLRELVRHGLEDGVRGEPLVRRLLPADDDYFVLKPKHSGFFQTVLEILLEHLGATTLILTGFAGDICVLFTANDAYLRDFRLLVPADCSASDSEDANRQALQLMEKVLRADLTPSAEIDLEALLAPSDGDQVDEAKPAAPAGESAAARSRAARAAGGG
jgi:nicotinamidase-related amidase